MSCTHASGWTLEESGYVRTWLTDIDPETGDITAYYGGSEDWSESGDGVMYLRCRTCLERRDIPADQEIDYQ